MTIARKLPETATLLAVIWTARRSLTTEEARRIAKSAGSQLASPARRAAATIAQASSSHSAAITILEGDLHRILLLGSVRLGGLAVKRRLRSRARAGGPRDRPGSRASSS